jgi:DNA-binding transcriptional LysR family regulator
MRAFVTVVDTGSFSDAADRLRTSPQVVSKYVKALEQDVDAQLLYRTTRRISLTEAGQAYLGRCRQILEDFDDLRRTLRKEDTRPRGHLVISGPMTFGEQVLAETVRDFLAAYPEVTIELKLTDRRVNLVDEGVDLAVRIGSLDDANLIVRKLGEVPVICCAAPAYLEREGTPGDPRELEHHNCLLDSNFRDPGKWCFRVEGGDVEVPVKGRLRVNSAEAVKQLAISGAGIALCPGYVMTDALSEGQLVQLFAGQPAYDFGLYAAYLPSRHLAAKVRTFIDFLVQRYRHL